VYEGWARLGVRHLTPGLVYERLDDYLGRLLAQLG
jgi:hypothetical protein